MIDLVRDHFSHMNIKPIFNAQLQFAQFAALRASTARDSRICACANSHITGTAALVCDEKRVRVD